MERFDIWRVRLESEDVTYVLDTEASHFREAAAVAIYMWYRHHREVCRVISVDKLDVSRPVYKWLHNESEIALNQVVNTPIEEEIS